MKTLVHINQPQLRQNALHGTRHPVITIKTYKDNRYGHQASLLDGQGREVARVLYCPDQPLGGEHTVWIEVRHGFVATDRIGVPLACYGACTLHVCPRAIRANGESGVMPVLRVLESNLLAYQGWLQDAEGHRVGEVVYRPEKPLSCGARLWLETQTPVRALDTSGVEMSLVEALSAAPVQACLLERL